MKALQNAVCRTHTHNQLFANFVFRKSVGAHDVTRQPTAVTTRRSTRDLQTPSQTAIVARRADGAMRGHVSRQLCTRSYGHLLPVPLDVRRLLQRAVGLALPELRLGRRREDHLGCI